MLSKKKKSVVNVYMLKVYFNNSVLPSRQLFVDIDNKLVDSAYKYFKDVDFNRIGLQFFYF